MREAGDPSCLGQAGRSSDHHHVPWHHHQHHTPTAAVTTRQAARNDTLDQILAGTAQDHEEGPTHFTYFNLVEKWYGGLEFRFKGL